MLSGLALPRRREDPMATLDRWRRFLTAPQTLRFPELSLMGDDHAPIIVKGSGEVQIETLARNTYRLTGRPSDLRYAFTELQRLRDDPYNGLARQRLFGVDEDGIEWLLGWTEPQVEAAPSSGDWVFTGSIEALMPEDESSTVAQESTTEVVFAFPVNSPMRRMMPYLLARSETDRDQPLVVEVLGSRLCLTYQPPEGALTVAIKHTEAFPPTYTENWLGEPLRIMFGQLIYPRLVARNLGGGRTVVFVRPSPGFLPEASWAALWRGGSPEAFWKLYTLLLTFVATARSGAGQRNWEPNKVTRLYEEIIQASRGSRWIWALTFASAIEALVRMLYPRGTPHPEADEAQAAALVSHIDAWEGSARLKTIARSAVQRSSELPTTAALRLLRREGVVAPPQYAAWDAVRNAVMHGSLLSPYSVEEEDERLLALVTLFHTLTREVAVRVRGDASP